MDKRPHIWKLRGVWYCGQPMMERIPLAPIFGHGSSPAEAYKDWVGVKWRSSRIAVAIEKHRATPAIEQVTMAGAARGGKFNMALILSAWRRLTGR